MELQVHTKRGASPCSSFAYTGTQCPVSGNSSKRSRQLLPGQQYVWQNGQFSKAQLSTALRRVQSAPIATETLEQQTCSDLEHWRSREGERRACPDQMGVIQGEVTPMMRTMLVDWLGEVRDEFRLHTETLFLAVAYLDRYMCAKPVSRPRFQLLGLACLWVAAKFEEVYPPPLGAMLAMAENMYSADDMRAMEKEVLFTLDFGLAVPTALRFLHYLLQLSPLPEQPKEATSARRLAEALLELTLLDTAFLKALPSHVAACAVYLALGLVRHHEGLHGVVQLSAAEPQALGELVQRLSKVLNGAASQYQPCAMLFRYKAWEGLHGGSALATAVLVTVCHPVAMWPEVTDGVRQQQRHQCQELEPQTHHVVQSELDALHHTAPTVQVSGGIGYVQSSYNVGRVGSPDHVGSPGHAASHGVSVAIGADRCVVNLSALSSLTIAATAACC